MFKPIFGFALLFWALGAQALDISGMDAKTAGEHIASQMQKSAAGYNNASAKMTMTLIAKNGKKSVRTLQTKALEVAEDGDKTLTIFSEPRDVKGTALLTIGHKNNPDEQWLYLPALRREKRINSSNQSGAFMGSEFAFEDLNSQDNSKYQTTLLAQEPLDGVPAYKLERIPKDADSGYTRQISWLQQEPLRTLRVDYYDRKNTLLKTLIFSDYALHEEKYWRAETMLMTNQQTGKATEIKLSAVKYNDPDIKVSDFSVNALKRLH